MPAPAEPRGLTKRELGRMKRAWTTTVRETITGLDVPAAATMRDMEVALEAVQGEIDAARAIVRVLAQPARPRPRRRQLKGLGS
jgi:hypothetical protein